MKSIATFFVLALVIVSCARVGTPIGGPKDEIPPVTVSAEPDFGSTNFKGQKIKINFDEYIKFKDLNKQLIISPPQKYQPEITPMGIASKSITIKLKDTLKPNTTYTFNFGNAIVDNAEGNVLKQFKYVFSTGDYIDSLELKGHVVNSMSDALPENTMILLYAMDSVYTDSTVYQRKPDYVGNTQDSTFFSITNIKKGQYKLLALKDGNANMIYEPQLDQIGFVEQTITLPTDSMFTLNLFKEELPFKINRLVEHSKNHFWIPYEGTWQSTVTDLTDKNNQPVSYVSFPSTEQDSIDVWYKDVATDSLFVTIKTDEIETFGLKLRKKDLDSLIIESSTTRTLHPNDSLFLITNNPITNIDSEKISIMDKDSMAVDFASVATDNPLKVLIDFKAKPDNNYMVNILPHAVTDFFTMTNDSINLSLKTKIKEEYGEIVLNINTGHALIVSLLDDKNHLIQLRYIDSTTELSFKSLIPGKYKVKFVVDDNNNKRWDTGNYLDKKQPERVIYLDKIIDLRANWTANETITIN